MKAIKYYCTMIPFFGWCIAIYDLVDMIINPNHDVKMVRYHETGLYPGILFMIIQIISFILVDRYIY